MNIVQRVAPTVVSVVPEQDRLAADLPEEGFGGVLESILAVVAQGEVQQGPPPAAESEAAVKGEAPQEAPAESTTLEQAVPAEPMADGEAAPTGPRSAIISPGGATQQAGMTQEALLGLELGSEVAQQPAQTPADFAPPVAGEMDSQAPTERVPPATEPILVAHLEADLGHPVEAAVPLKEGTPLQVTGEATRLVAVVEESGEPPMGDAVTGRSGMVVQAASDAAEKVASVGVPTTIAESGSNGNPAATPEPETGQAQPNVASAAPAATQGVAEAQGDALERIPLKAEVIITREEEESAASPSRTSEPAPSGVKEVESAKAAAAEVAGERQARVAARAPEATIRSSPERLVEAEALPAKAVLKGPVQAKEAIAPESAAEPMAPEARKADLEFSAKVQASGKAEAQTQEAMAGHSEDIPRAHAAESASTGQAQAPQAVSGRAVRLSQVPEAHPKLVPQATTAVRLALHSPQHSARLTLEPPQLGRLQVEITVEEGRVDAVFRTGTDGARQGLLQSMEHLRSSIEEHGVRVGSMEVLLDNGTARFARGFAHRQSSGDGNPPPNAGASHEAELPVEHVALRASSALMLDLVA